MFCSQQFHKATYQELCVWIHINIKSMQLQVQGTIAIYNWSLKQHSLCRVDPLLTVLPLFLPPSSVCLDGHILKFPQAQFVMQSCFSSHLKDVVFCMVMRPSLFQLLHCSLIPISFCSLRASSVMAEPWRAFQSKQLTSYSVRILKTDLHQFQVLSCYVLCKEFL